MKLRQIMIVEIAIIGLAGYWCFRAPSELRAYEEAFLKEFVYPYENITSPIQSVFRDQDELSLKLCKRFVKKQKPPCLITHYLGFKKAIHEPILVEMVQCGRDIALIQAPGINSFYVLRKGRRNNRFDSRIFYIYNKSYYITCYEDSANKDRSALARTSSQNHNANLSTSETVRAGLTRSCSAPRAHFSESSRREFPEQFPPDRTVVQSDINGAELDRSRSKPEGSPSNHLSVRSPRGYTALTDGQRARIHLSNPRSNSGRNEHPDASHSSDLVTFQYVNDNSFKRGIKFLEHIFTKSRLKRDRAKNFDTPNANHIALDRSKSTPNQSSRVSRNREDDRYVAGAPPGTVPFKESVGRAPIDQSYDHYDSSRSNVKPGELGHSKSVPKERDRPHPQGYFPAHYGPVDEDRRIEMSVPPYETRARRDYFPPVEKDRTGMPMVENHFARQTVAPPYDPRTSQVHPPAPYKVGTDYDGTTGENRRLEQTYPSRYHYTALDSYDSHLPRAPHQSMVRQEYRPPSGENHSVERMLASKSDYVIRAPLYDDDGCFETAGISSAPPKHVNRDFQPKTPTPGIDSSKPYEEPVSVMRDSLIRQGNFSTQSENHHPNMTQLPLRDQQAVPVVKQGLSYTKFLGTSRDEYPDHDRRTRVSSEGRETSSASGENGKRSSVRSGRDYSSVPVHRSEPTHVCTKCSLTSGEIRSAEKGRTPKHNSSAGGHQDSSMPVADRNVRTPRYAEAAHRFTSSAAQNEDRSSTRDSQNYSTMSIADRRVQTPRFSENRRVETGGRTLREDGNFARFKTARQDLSSSDDDNSFEEERRAPATSRTAENYSSMSKFPHSSSVRRVYFLDEDESDDSSSEIVPKPKTVKKTKTGINLRRRKS